MTIGWTSNSREITNAIRDVIGRAIVFQIENKVACTYSGCGVDPITNTAINSFCPVCSGEGYLITISGITINAHVTWKPEGIMNWVTGGQFFSGDCIAQLEYTDSSISTVNQAKYVVIDDKRMRIKSKILRGVPSINRVILDCELEEE